MTIDEYTWHPKESSQTTFAWECEKAGVRVDHGDGRSPYLIPWHVFSAVLIQAQRMAHANNGLVAAGTTQDNPSPGSVGAWVVNQHLPIEKGKLTPRHLSFLGPIFGRMCLVKRRVKGNSIQWQFK